MVALTGKADAYYTDYRGTAQEFVSAAKYGYLVPGAVVSLAEATARNAPPSACRKATHGQLHPESRPDGELG